jgi:S-adenosyl-L-methionine hydrolase (adenosine-forming)
VTRVVLLTDFGTADGYAAAMAGVVATGAPRCVVEHASHDIPPGDILAAALALSRYADRFPRGTVHLTVVDPGVGTRRRALAATIDGRHYVGPDNGILTLVLRTAKQVDIVHVGHAISDDAHVAPTFHGRDIFAPAAARLARGEPLETLGPALADPILLDLPQPERTADEVRGQVIQVDRFGNLITNIPAPWLEELARDDRKTAGGSRELAVRLEAVDAGPLRRTYGDVPPGCVVALIGSLELLEISVRDGNGARALGASRGSRVVVQPSPRASPRP